MVKGFELLLWVDERKGYHVTFPLPWEKKVISYRGKYGKAKDWQKREGKMPINYSAKDYKRCCKGVEVAS